MLFRLGVGVGGKIIPRIRLTSAKDLVEVEAELGNIDIFEIIAPLLTHGKTVSKSYVIRTISITYLS